MIKKLAIIGASYLQVPLIEKAKEKNIETHVFAWATGDVGEEIADYFHPISIVDKQEILAKCREIGVDGICSIASDLAAVTVAYVANEMGLIANDMSCVEKSTNKHLMRECFEENGDPSPKSIKVESLDDLNGIELVYPIIVKPLDRSGSRGITKLSSENGLGAAIENAKEQGFEKSALVEEFAEGQEYSVEYISWEGQHRFLALTKKYTTGAPSFIETGHIEPAPVDSKTLENVKRVVEHALDSLGIKYGASHSELKIDNNGIIRIIEIGGRMGGDFIGSNLVRLSTGYDFVEAVIDVALGEEPKQYERIEKNAAVRFVMNQQDKNHVERIIASYPTYVVQSEIAKVIDSEVTDSSNRFGYVLLNAVSEVDLEEIIQWS